MSAPTVGMIGAGQLAQMSLTPGIALGINFIILANNESDSAAKIAIVEIGDYQCPACKSWFDNTRQDIIENYIENGKANLVFIDMPFIGADSTSAAEATYCANDQGMYWEYHTTLYQLQQHENDGWANIDRLTAIAFNLGLDTEQFNECMISKKYFSQITSRAFAEASKTIQLTKHLLEENGRYLLMKGSNVDKEDVDNFNVKVYSMKVPFVSDKRSLLEIQL